MSRSLLVLALVIAALVLAPLQARATETLSVFVSVVPQETIVARIGGDRVRVQALVQPGQSPHAYEPTARQIAALAEADLYVRIGVGFEDAWMTRLQGANPGMRILDSREGIALRPDDPGHHHDHADHDHHHHDPDGMDPHIWTSPTRVKQMGLVIRDALTALDPEHAATFASNYDHFAAELDALDARIRARLAGVEPRRFMVYHPAWGYFADDYGLEQVAIEREGKEPGARALAALIEQARREGIRVIFVQPQIDPSAARRVAEAIDGEVAVIDPLAGDYFENLQRVADLIAGAARP